MNFSQAELLSFQEMEAVIGGSAFNAGNGLTFNSKPPAVNVDDPR